MFAQIKQHAQGTQASSFCIISVTALFNFVPMAYHPLEHRILHTIRRHQLIKENDQVLVALSGGLDSMVLLHLLHRLHYTIAAAHMNFGLRGDQSEADAVHCASVCREMRIAFFQNKVTTLTQSEQWNVSVQMAARTLRYTWFKELMEQHPFSTLATAHHLNDQAETVLLNLTEGKGAASLRGIPLRNGNIIRPLLEISREEIENYAREKGIIWREDESNLTDLYKRNFVRHQILPLLEQMQSAAVANISKTAERIHEWNLLADEMAEKILHPCFEEKGPMMILHTQTIRQHPAARLLLWKALAPYGFEGNQIDDLLNSIDETGKTFFSKKYRIAVDRNRLFIEPSDLEQPEPVLLDQEHPQANFGNQRIHLTITERSAQLPASGKDTALIDAAQLLFPLTIRSWKAGDHFMPLGMKSMKKLSDFFIDLKIPLSEKQAIPIICSGENIIWVAGHRMDERFKITDETRKIAILQRYPHDNNS